MAIERARGKVSLSCDSCNEPLKKSSNGKEIWHDNEDFDIVIADARDEGWLIEKVKGTYEHYCPDCH